MVISFAQHSSAEGRFTCLIPRIWTHFQSRPSTSRMDASCPTSKSLTIAKGYGYSLIWIIAHPHTHCHPVRSGCCISALLTRPSTSAFPTLTISSCTFATCNRKRKINEILRPLRSGMGNSCRLPNGYCDHPHHQANRSDAGYTYFQYVPTMEQHRGPHLLSSG